METIKDDQEPVMTDQEINVAVAEACGWSSFGLWNGNPNQPAAFAPGKHISQPIPNYCHDLNAMHEAEEKLNKTQWVKYECEVLPHVCWGFVTSQPGLHFQGKTTHAISRQRAEAFLRTLGKWKE